MVTHSNVSADTARPCFRSSTIALGNIPVRRDEVSRVFCDGQIYSQRDLPFSVSPPPARPFARPRYPPNWSSIFPAVRPHASELGKAFNSTFFVTHHVDKIVDEFSLLGIDDIELTQNGLDVRTLRRTFLPTVLHQL